MVSRSYILSNYTTDSDCYTVYCNYVIRKSYPSPNTAMAALLATPNCCILKSPWIHIQATLYLKAA